METLEVTLWILIGSGIYTTIGYPVLLMLLGRLLRRHFIREPIRPPASLIIAAHNEERAIAAKLENSLASDYPRDKLEILVVSDGSTDRTEEIVRGFADRGVRLLALEGKHGKTAALNMAATGATGDLLVFSDATGMWSTDAVAALASHFADPRVGCVSGRVGYTYDGGMAAQGFGVYQRYMLYLRRSEGAFGSGFNASGSIHAVRKSIFRPGPPDTFMDMVDPLHAAMHGYLTTFEPHAVSMEEARTRTSDEFNARLRIASRSWRFLLYAIPRLPFRRSPMYCFQVISHKFLRWMIGPSLPLILLLTVALAVHHPLYQLLLIGQLLFYLLTGLAFSMSRLGIRLPGLSALLFFNTTNLAYLISLVRYLFGERVSHWVPSR